MKGRLPTFIVIGAMKGGTSSLHRWLSRVPGVQMAQPKELNFFRRERISATGLPWYMSHFGDAPVRGEASPNYTDRDRDPGVAGRIAEVIPDVKLIYLVRHPIQRTLSAYRHGLSRHWGGGRDIGSLGDPHHPQVRRSLYSFQIEPFLERFERSSIHIGAFEDLIRDGSEERAEILRFIGVDPAAALEAKGSPFPRENDGSNKRRLSPLGRRIDQAISPHLQYRPHGYALLYLALLPFTRRLGPLNLPPDVEARLQDLFRPDLDRLHQLTGHDFRPLWGMG